MDFLPNRIRVNFGNSVTESIEIGGKSEVSCPKLKLTFKVSDDGVITPVIRALEDIAPEWLNIEFDIPEEALGDELYYYYAAFTTNDITSVFKHSIKPKNDMKDVFVAKNTAKNLNMNIGLRTPVMDKLRRPDVLRPESAERKESFRQTVYLRHRCELQHCGHR